MRFIRRAETWDFNIDHYLNRIIPPSPLHTLPVPISRFLGYRKQQKPDVGNVLGALYSFVGAFCGLAVVAAIFNNDWSIQARHPPALIASFGASAVLEYNVIRSPLGQPRNAFLGHTFSALIGVGITKLFLFHPEFERIRWIAGAISCGIASAVMLLTGTVHPPGGASAVLAATSPDITDMGWYFVALVMFGTTMMLIVGLLINNLQRQFPMYWWSPLDVGPKRKKTVEEGVMSNVKIQLDSTGDVAHERKNVIYISAREVVLPKDLMLNQEEAKLLESLKGRIGDLELTRHAETARSSTEDTIVSSHLADNDVLTAYP
ncbi:HPP family protein [Massarina eburnea CBS 473.64]|uniref:HPP family protein n=1 Tax=Massarina eburnea CBS 473.64 TaxID=1395130 RepID=A0A6A6RV35_9PLEO|nr:HPP family protein [Massarina eburnea CBS 473.64]